MSKMGLVFELYLLADFDKRTRSDIYNSYHISYFIMSNEIIGWLKILLTTSKIESIMITAVIIKYNCFHSKV